VALVMVAVIQLHLNTDSIKDWLPLLWPAGAVAIAVSAVLVTRAPVQRRTTTGL
jgi:hypothetical protein